MSDNGLGAKRCVREAKPLPLNVPTGHYGGLDLAPAKATKLGHRTSPGLLPKRVTQGDQENHWQAHDGDAAIFTFADAKG